MGTPNTLIYKKTDFPPFVILKASTGEYLSANDSEIMMADYVCIED